MCGSAMRTLWLLLGAAVLCGAAPVSPTALAAQYVVDQASPAASDDNPGTAEKPFKTISKGVSVAQAGDTVLVKAGVYREQVVFKTSGTAEKRITLKAAPGERVVASGAQPISGWKKCTREELRGNPNWANIYWTTIDWQPVSFYADGRLQTLARWPKVDKTMHRAQDGDATKIVDAEHLTQPAGCWDGATLVVRGPSGFREVRGRIVNYDAEKHELTVDKPRTFPLKTGESDEGLYFIENALAAICEPGQFVLDTSVTPHKLYLWPPGGGDAAGHAVEGSRLGRGTILVTWSAGVGYLTIDGLEIAYAEGGGVGSTEKGGHHVEVLNCVVHHDRSPGAGAGIRFYGQADCAVRRCISTRNASHGLSIGSCQRIVAEEIEIFNNGVDGAVVATCEDVRVARCYIHDQWYEGHPDGFQTFSGVERLVMDSVLILNCGQIWQCANVFNSRMVNNMFVGSHGGGLSITPRSFKGYGPNEKHEWRNNTLAFFVVGGLNVVKDFRVANNVIAPGGVGLMNTTTENPWQSDYNLFWSYGDKAFISWKGKSLPFEEYRKTSGQDEHSKLAYPKFRSAPSIYVGGDSKKGPWYDLAGNANTAGKLHLGRFPKGGFEVGDFVEVNWDGVRRKVAALGDGYIVVDPPLKESPRSSDFTVCNWKKQGVFALDLRLADDSPGKKMGDDGKDAGSSIDIQAYMKGDFDGDGRRDLPPLPPALAGR